MREISIEERAVKLARYIIDSKDTVRGTAKKFGISKSTVHKDLSQRLENINHSLYLEVREVLDENKAGENGKGDEDRQVGRISIPQGLVWNDIIDEQRVGVAWEVPQW